MMRQYLDIKEKYQDAILFFRLGDFYEMFFEDAVEASKILGITLTTRNKNDSNPIPLCGIPYHAAPGYLSKLIAEGKKVAICDQVEDPKEAKGVVKREVTRVVTPGLLVDEGNLNSKETNYLAALSLSNSFFGLAYVDISTGDFRAMQLPAEEACSLDTLKDELLRIEPKELVYSPLLLEKVSSFEEILTFFFSTTQLDKEYWLHDEGRERIKKQFNVTSLEGLGCEEMEAAISAAGAILRYLEETQGCGSGHIDRLKPYSIDSFMLIDSATKNNLELTVSLQGGDKKGTLYHILDSAETAMGSRCLKEWISYPLQDITKINGRLDAVSAFFDRPGERKEMKELLGRIYDIERLNGRVSLGRATPRDLISLRNSIKELPLIKGGLDPFDAPFLRDISDKIDPVPELEALISEAIEDEPPINIKEGGIIREGHNAELDELREISREGKGYLAKMEAREKERTGISSLKVRFNRVFGYYIEVTKTNLHLVPDDYLRKQTLATAERFITPELKEYEAKILGADERIREMEYELFTEIREATATYSQKLKETATSIASLDSLVSLADVADRYGYCRPQVDSSELINIEGGRHPVVERLNPDEPFVPNDTSLDSEDEQLMIITGPNMAGKSTYIRQVALIALMAHMGSFVPATSARIGLVDRIFTRVGASDNLAKGQSTFMVEMTETANILNNATEKSLIILDEIGRGTSTFDGVSIAWAVAEHVHDISEKGVRALFATHYHELTELAITKERVANYNVAVKEWNDSIIFLRKIIKGSASRSYGIEVGRLAGLPGEVVARAREILSNLETGEFVEEGMPRLALHRASVDKSEDKKKQMSLFMPASEHVMEEIRSIDLTNMTPLEALNLLGRFKEEVS